MNGKRLGYVRVSTLDQNPERQLELLNANKVFTDKASGKDTQRPALMELLDYAREGDTIGVHSMDRLARNLDDLRQLVSRLTEKQIRVEFIKEGLIFTGDDSAISKLLLSVMGAFSEFERSLIKERQREGIAIAKQKGLYKGRKRKMTDEQIREINLRINQGESKTALAKEFGISRETLYQHLTK
jgi:DNA invertase Pin-like site-specific DNA recombinase